MQLKLEDLRHMAQMAQFSERAPRADVLRFIEQSGNLKGDVWISMDADSVKVAGKAE